MKSVPLSYRGSHRQDRAPLVGSSSDATNAKKCFRLYGFGPRYLNSVCSQYSDDYTGELRDFINESDFIRTMARINRLLATYWPCSTLFVFGIACSPCSLACGICFPSLCMPEVERKLVEDLRDISLHARYYDRGIEWRLKKEFLSSSIEILVPMSVSGLDSAGGVDIEVGRGAKES